MGTVQIAREAADVLLAIAEDAQLGDCAGGGYVYVEDGGVLASLYLGTAFGLDPCGRYHCIFADNGSGVRCGRFWESLSRQLERRGLSLSNGEGDPCDNFAVRYLRDATEQDQAEDTGYGVYDGE